MTETRTSPSAERVTLGNGVRLAIYPTPKLKTIIVKASLTGNLEQRVTRRALVPMVLRRGTTSFPDMQAIQRHLEELYGASLGADVSKIGEWHALKFRLESVNGSFLPAENDVFRDALSFLHELVYGPALANGAFREDYVEQEKLNLGRIIDGLIDSKSQYAFERMIQSMAANEEFRRYDYGSKDDIPGIDPAALTTEWRSAVDGFPLELAIAGDIDVSSTTGICEELFGAPRSETIALAPVPGARPVKEIKQVEERMDVSQGKLCLGYRFGASYSRGDLPAAVLMNGILGSFSHSKLFQNVREKASLAYDAYSSFERTMGMVFISCGIAVENFEKARDICFEQVRALQNGEISEAELVSTKESFENQLAMLEDNFSGLMEVDYTWRLNGREFDLFEYRRELREVTRERIVESARTLELDTVYFLRD